MKFTASTLKRVAWKIPKVLLFIGSFLPDFQLIAQANFVTNGGFEKFQSCTGATVGYLEPLILGWDEIDQVQAAKWNHPCYGAVPFNLFFYNYPRTGDAYASLDVFCLPCEPTLNRTNLRNTLKNVLKQGIGYCVKYYVNNSEKSSYSVDAFDVYFGGSELDTIVYAHVPLTYLASQINNSSGVYHTDTVGWTAVTGTFTAKGTEKYMVIGNLRSDSNTNRITNNPTQASQQWSFCTVGIDDISCIPIDLPAYAGTDTSILPGDSVYLGRESDVEIDESCQWFVLPNDTVPIDTIAGMWVKPTVKTTYVVRQQLWCSGVKWDTVTVHINNVGLLEDELNARTISVYPNPTKGDLRIKLDGLTNKTINFRVYDVLGQTFIVPVEKVSDREYLLNTENLSNGTYLLEVGNRATAKRFSVLR